MEGLDGLTTATLRAYVAIIDHRGVSAAARALGAPKSGVSRALAQVEAQAGLRLVTRSTRSFRPTEAGQVLAERCRAVLLELEEALDEARGRSRDPEGLLRVTMPTLVAATLASTVIPAFLERCPRVRLHVQATNRMVDLAAEGIDAAVRVGSLPETSTPVRRLGMIHTVVVASPAYARTRQLPRSVAQLARHRWVSFPGGSMGGVAEQDARVIADDFTALRTLALAGVGLAWLPRFLVSADLEAGTLVQVLPRLPPAGPPLGIAVPAGRRGSAAARAWIEHLVETLPGALQLIRPRGSRERPMR